MGSREKGSVEHLEVRCRQVAQTLGDGGRLDELFAGTPSLASAKDLSIVLLGRKGAFVRGALRRKVYIELPRQDARHEKERAMGKLEKDMFRTRDAPPIWSNKTAKGEMDFIHR